MTSSSTRRRAAVMIADVAGYSRRMERDEAGTHARLLQVRAELTDPVVLRHGGRGAMPCWAAPTRCRCAPSRCDPTLPKPGARGPTCLPYLRRFDATAEAVQRGLALNPSGAGHGVLLHLRCRALLLLARFAEAIDACERGTALGPEWPDCMVPTAARALNGEARQAGRARAEPMRLQPAVAIGRHEALAGAAAPTAFDRVLHEGLRRAGVPD